MAPKPKPVKNVPPRRGVAAPSAPVTGKPARPVKTPKPVAAAPAAAPKPMAAVPGKKYRYITILDPKTKQLKRVSMEAGKALSIMQRRNAAKSAGAANAQRAADDQLVPGPYRGLVDSSSIAKGVDSAIASEITPFNAAAELAKLQQQRNMDAGQSLLAQTQSTIGSALDNVNRGTGIAQASAAQQAAAMRGTNDAAAAELLRITSGGQVNPLLAGMIGQAAADQGAAQNQAGVQNVTDAGLGGQLQGDFLQRAQGIAGMQQQAFGNAQQQRLSDVLAQIASQIASTKANRANLIQQQAEKEGQFLMEQQVAASIAGQEAAAAGNKLAVDKYNAETGRLSVAQRAQAAQDAAAQKAQKAAIAAQKAKGRWGLGEKLDKVIDQIGQRVMGAADQVGRPDKNGVVQTNESVFHKGNGPWRAAFSQLSAAKVPPNTAALIATTWFKDSIARSTPRKLIEMFDRLGVPAATQRNIIDRPQFFGPGAYGKATRTTSGEAVVGGIQAIANGLGFGGSAGAAPASSGSSSTDTSSGRPPKPTRSPHTGGPVPANWEWFWNGTAWAYRMKRGS